MPPPVPTTIASGFSDAVGSAYRLTSDLLYVADAGSGHIETVNAHTHVKTTVGTGYNAPSDVELSIDGLHAYVTENPGTLLRVSLTNMNRAAATVVASGLNGVDQVALDEAHGFAYVCEFTGGHIQRVNLTSGVKSVAATIATPRGVLVTDDGRFLYVSTDAGTITRFDLTTNTHVTIASGLNAPRHLTWADAGESTILFPQRNPTPRVRKADLTTTPATVTTLAGPDRVRPVQRHRPLLQPAADRVRLGGPGGRPHLVGVLGGRADPARHRLCARRRRAPAERLRGHDDRPELLLPGEGLPVRRDAAADDQLGARAQHRRELLPGVDRGPRRAARCRSPSRSATTCGASRSTSSSCRPRRPRRSCPRRRAAGSTCCARRARSGSTTGSDCCSTPRAGRTA